MNKIIKSSTLLFLSIFLFLTFIQGQTLMPVPTPTSTYPGMVRGYWFTAPCDFTIVGLRIPSVLSTNNSYISVLDFGTTPPPVYAGTTNTFTTLVTITNVPGTTMIPVNASVLSGHVIGILSCRSSGTGETMYAPNGPYATTINGLPVTLVRMGMQYDLTTTAPQDIWQEPTSSNLGICEMYYSVYTYKDDAGVITMNSPSSPLTPGITNVTCSIKNFGSDTLKSVGLRWSVDGVMQSAPSNWTGTLVKKDTAGPITLGSYNFASGFHVIKAWTVSPNGHLDSNRINDTTVLDLICCNPANGTYVIDRLGTGNFQTFNEAVSWLTNCGVSGPVTFRVKNGTYNERVEIPAIAGVSSTNTITFESYNLDSTAVILTYSSVGSMDYATLCLNKADYITFRKMTIQAMGSNYGRAVEFLNNADWNTIANNILQIPQVSSSNYAVVYSGTSIDQNNTIRNNQIIGGYYGIYLLASGSTSQESGNVIEGNTIRDFYYFGIYIQYQNALAVRKNNIINSVYSASVYGIYSYYCYDNIDYSKNKIRLTSNSTIYGIYSYYNSGTSSLFGKLSNNFIILDGTSTGTFYGIYMSSPAYQNVSFNSINITGTNSTSKYNFYLTGGTSSSVSLKNNIFANFCTGYACYIGTTATISASNYNDLFTNGSNLGYWSGARASLSAWQSASSQDANSVSVNPGFFSLTDLHVNLSALNSAGTPISGITDDFDGDTRQNPPDIGADEFTPTANDAGVIDLVSLRPACAGSNNVIVRIKNYGTATLTSVIVNWQINGVNQSPDTFNLSLTQLQESNLNLGSISISIGSMYNFKFWTTRPNSATDGNNRNDTLVYLNMKSAMTGTYTIGTSGNFKSFNDAISDLGYRGVCGAVKFRVFAGTYYENLRFNTIPGASAINTITFESYNLDSNSVEVNYNAFGTTDNYLVQLDGAKYIIIQNMTFRSTSINGYSCIVDIRNGASYNIIRNSNLVGSTVISSYSVGVWMQQTGSTCNYNLVDNNNILNNYYALQLYGISTSQPAKGNIIRNNKISWFYYMGMYLYYQDSIEIKGNVLNSVSAYYGMYCYYVSNASYIASNQLYMSSSSTMYGLYMNYCYGNSVNNLMVINNMISLYGTSTGTAYAVYSYYCNYNKFYHNSFWVSCGSSSAGRTMYFNSPTSGSYGNIEMQNNFIINTGGGYAIYVESGAVTIGYIKKSNYNDIYVTGSFICHRGTLDGVGLANWKLMSGQDPRSISVMPLFLSNQNLHLASIIGLVVANSVGVLEDIDGNPRSSKLPVIGADENLHLPDDAGISGITSPSKTACDGILPVTANLYNFGTNNLDSVYIDYLLNGVLRKTLTWKGSLPYLSAASVSFGMDTFTFGHPAKIKIITRLPNGKTTDTFRFNDADSLELKLYPLPKIQSVSGDTVCKGDTALLKVSSPNSKIFYWYDSSVAGNIVSEDSVFKTGPLYASKTYYVEAATAGVPVKITTLSSTVGTEMGNMFDVRAVNSDVYIDSFAVHSAMSVGMSMPVAVYYKSGSYKGYETSPISWSLLGYDTVISEGSAVYTDISPGGVRIKKGQTFGFYVTSTDPGVLLYSTDGAKIITDAYLEITTGTKTFYPFDAYFQPNKSWNGAIYYETGSLCNSARIPVPALLKKVPAVKLGNDTSVCKGAKLNLDAGTGPDFSYAWKFGNAPDTISTLRFITIDSTGNYNVTVTDLCGNTDYDTFSLVANPLPKAVFTINNEKQCFDGNKFIFTNSSTIPGGFIKSWKWQYDDGKSDTMKNPTHSYKSVDTCQVKLYAFSDKGCSDSFMKQVFIFHSPKASFSVNDTGQCLSGNKFIFSNLSSIPSGNISSYSWKFGDGDSSILSNPFHTYKSADTFTIRMIAVSNLKCPAEKSLDVIVYPQPDADFEVNDNSQCLLGNKFEFTNKSIIQSGNLNYLWFSGDGNSSANTNYSHSYGVEGIYKTKLYAVSGFYCVDSSEQLVTVKSHPVVNLGKDTTLWDYQSILLDAGSGLDTFLWSNGKTTRQITVDSSGIGLSTRLFWVEVTKDGCKGYDTIYITFKHNTGITKDGGEISIKVYPNPAKSLLNVDLKGLNEITFIELADLQGNAIFNFKEIPFNGRILKEINISSLSDGVYFLKIYNEMFDRIVKVVKEQ